MVSREEVKKVAQAVRKADEGAFINEVKTDELSGRFYQKPTD